MSIEIIIKDNLPWISAIVICLLTIYSNYRISSRNIETTFKVVQLEFNRTVLSTNRQVWINSLRDLISDYMSKIKSYKMTVDLQLIQDEKELLNLLDGKLEEIFQVSSKIRLMLNSNEEDSKKLTALLDRYNTSLFDKVITQNSEYFEREIYIQTELILKKEWVRVKNGT